MTSLRIVMMGTGDFALPTFQTLYDTPHEVVALYTQPDRIAPGRKQRHENRMKDWAESRHTQVLQPESVNTPEALAELRLLNPDLLVVAAYGQILSPELLSIPKLAAINVHASLLPRHRGAAPINYAIWKGDSETGVSIIQILPQLDAGPVLAIARTPIGPRETAGDLEVRLAQIGAGLVPPVIEQLRTGTAVSIPQDPQLVTRCPKMKKELGEIVWTESPAEIDQRVRAMQPWPGPSSHLHMPGRPTERMLVLEVASTGDVGSGDPGLIASTAHGRLLVQTGSGVLEILRVQPTGKRPMPTADFLRGHPIPSGSWFGPALP